MSPRDASPMQSRLSPTPIVVLIVANLPQSCAAAPLARRANGLRLEGWRLARPSPAAILRDASLTRCPQDEVRGRCRYDSNFEIVELADTPLCQQRGHGKFVEQRAGTRAG